MNTRSENVSRLRVPNPQDPHVVGLFQSLFPDPMTVYRLARVFADLVSETRATRPKVWRAGDLERIENSQWLLDEVQYMGYVNFIGTENGKGKFRTLASRLGPIVDGLGASTLYALPFLQSPFGDAGFDVSDYREVDPRFGGNESFRAFRRALARKNGAFQMDLVFNHVSNEHAWAKQVLGDSVEAKKYFHILDEAPHVVGVVRDASGLPLSAKYRELDARGNEITVERRVVFPAFANPEHPHYTKLTTQAGKSIWVLHTFYPFQWDLNYSHAPVVEEALAVLSYWVNEGADILRLDAIPHLYKQMESDPRIMKVVELFRYFVAKTSPRTSVLVEANQSPAIVMKYFGSSTSIEVEHLGRIQDTSSGAQLAYNFDQAIHSWASLLTADKSYLLEGIIRTPPAPAHTVWAHFLRSHDELSLSKAPDKIRDVIQKELIDTKRGVPFRGARGVGGRMANFLDHDARRVVMAHAHLLSLHGHPILYYGDEIMAKSDSEYARAAAAERGGQYDSRDEGRGPITAKAFDDAINGKGPGAESFRGIQRLIAVRKQRLSLRRGTLHIVETDHPAVVGYSRTVLDREVTLVLFNLSGETVSTFVSYDQAPKHLQDLISDREVEHQKKEGGFLLNLAPFESLWLNAR